MDLDFDLKVEDSDLDFEDLFLICTCITYVFGNLISALVLAENDGSNMHLQ